MIKAEARQEWGTVAMDLARMGVDWSSWGCPTMAIALFQATIELGRRHHHPRPTMTALLNIATHLKNRELDGALANGREAVEVALQIGARDALPMAALNLGLTCWISGDWDEAEALVEQYRDDLPNHPLEQNLISSLVHLVRSARGLPPDPEEPQVSFGGEDYGSSALLAGLQAEARGDRDAAARELIRSLDENVVVGGLDDDFAVVWPLAVEAAVAVGSWAEAERLLAYITDAPAGLVTPLAAAHLPRLRALLAIAAGGTDDGAIDADLERAVDAMRAFGARFYLGRALLERGRRFAGRGDDAGAAPLLDEARSIFSELRADRWAAETSQVGAGR
jgi:tetratricopeptide (TPR) repeat protein